MPVFGYRECIDLKSSKVLAKLKKVSPCSATSIRFVTLNKSETYKETIKGKFHHIPPHYRTFGFRAFVHSC